MIDIINSGKFLFQHQFNKYPVVRSFNYRDDAIGMEFTVYNPDTKNIRPKKPGKVILSFHGMTLLGNNDPKFTNACKALCGCGYTVIAPQINSMQDLRIDTSEIACITEMIDRITRNRELCPEGKLSIFAASFAGGISLMASSDAKVSKKISSICLIGSFGNMESSINFLLCNQESDDYGRLIILKNFLKYSIKVSENIYKAFDIAISDNFYKREQPELPEFLENLSLKDFDITIRLLNDPDFRLLHWSRIKKNNEFAKIMDRYSMDNYLEKITASILVIHGICDNVIPQEESIRLFSDLKKTKIRSKLILTPLMGHSELIININVLPAIIDLLKGLSFFFSEI